jgi:hypothetical protein
VRGACSGRPPGRSGLPGGGIAGGCLPGGAGDEGCDDVGSVPVQGDTGRSYRMVVGGLACDAASCTSRRGTPASRAAVMNAWRSVCGPTGLLIPARRASRRTIRPAPRRSNRRPSAARKIGPSQRSPIARSIAVAVRDYPSRTEAPAGDIYSAGQSASLHDSTREPQRSIRSNR